MEEYLPSDIEYTRIDAVRQRQMHTTIPLVLEPISFGVQIATEKLKRYELRGTDQILAELLQAGGNKLHSGIHKLINSI